MYAEYLVFSWTQDSTAETTRADIQEKIRSFAEGDVEHATDMLCLIWEIASKDGDIILPASASIVSLPSQPASSAPKHLFRARGLLGMRVRYTGRRLRQPSLNQSAAGFSST